ncbi:MAG TPA: FG-GAP-like repeat-containing protein, partial [Chloroflexota bacterium]|nr:FG-GAP-like repeat-containing protein [Chloroflexota bacterium]
AYVPALGDVNGDGFVDMVVANTNHLPSRLYLTNGAPLTSGGYSTVQIGTDLGYGQNAVIADVNGDGKPDIILTYEVAETLATDPSGIAIYFNNGSSNPFANVTPIRLLVGQSISAIAVADLNGDGRPDLIVSAASNANSTSTLYVYLNTGSASQPFATATTLEADQHLGGPCVGVTVGDVNGDGLPDLIFACESPPPNTSPTPANPAEAAIYLNNGTVSPFSQVAPVDIPATTYSGFAYSTALGKLVKNGPLDVLVSDQNGLGGYSSITFDQDPAAQNDSEVCAVNKSVAINVLANDAAGPGETLNPNSVTVTTAPQHGTTSVNTTTGTVTYQPATTYSGTDSFQYTVRDKLGALSNTATVSMRVQPAPAANNDTATLQANHSITLNVLANDSSNGGTLDAASVKIVAPPAHGSAVANSGAVVYTPTSGYSGLDTFQYTVQDNLATVSNPATVSIEVTAPPSGGGGGSLGLFDLLGLAGILLIPSLAIRR